MYMCRPTLQSFIGSLVYSLWPACAAWLLLYFGGEELHVLLKIASYLMITFSVALVLLDISVHLRRAYFDERLFGVIGLFGRNHVLWEDVTSAVLKERTNAISRTDHFLILNGTHSLVSYNTSTLPADCEQLLLDFVGDRVALVVEKAKPTI